MRFRFLPNIATADLAFQAFGKNYSELFKNAALALESAMVDLKSIKAGKEKEIKLEGVSIENLLSSFLEELIFLKDAEQLLFNRIVCKVMRKSERYVLMSKLSGEKIDYQKHKLGDDVKAVTKHLFMVEKLPDSTLRCLVVVDV